MKIRNSSRITAIALALLMIVPLISIPTVAAGKSTNVEDAAVSAPVWSEDFNDGTRADAFQQYPYASELVYGIGGSGSTAYKIEQKATSLQEIRIVWADNTSYNDGSWTVKSIQYADGREWTGIAKYDGSDVTITNNTNSWVYTGKINLTKDYVKTANWSAAAKEGDALAGDNATRYKCVAFVEGVLANAIVGSMATTESTIAREAYLKNPKIDITDEKVFVLEANYYFDADFSSQFEGRTYGIDSASVTTPIDLFRAKPSGSNVQILRHNDCVDVKNGDVGVLVKKGEWVNIKFVIDAYKGYPTISCFVNDSFAFTVDESTNWKDKTLTSLKENHWNLGHTSRGVNANTIKGSIAIDDANIYTTTAGMKLKMWSNDVDSASKINDIFYSWVPGNKISIDSTTFAGTDHGDVIAWDNVPYVDGSYWLYTGSGHFGANNNNKITNITVTNGKATGSVKVGSTTYYFKDATVCTTTRTQTKATMYTDEACTTAASVTYYICNGAVVTAYTGGSGGNIATPSVISKGQTGQKFTISADYNFGLDLACKGMDIRLHSPNVEMFSVGSTNANATTITVKLHSNLSTADSIGKGNVVYVNNTLTISKGEWHNFTVTFDSTADGNGTLITGYVDGQLVGKIFQNSAEMTQLIWNVGHTTRTGHVSDNKGHWYMDNFTIYYGDVIPAEWKAEKDSSIIYEENFDLRGKTAIGSNVYYGGKEYSVVDLGDGNKAFRIESDTLPDDNVQANGIVSNLDQNLFTKNPAIDAATYGESIVIEASYFLESNARQQIEAQLRRVDADYSTTFGTAGGKTGTANYVQLYTIMNKGDYAYFGNFGSTASAALAKTTYYNITCPTGRWFTISTVINLKTGAMSFYVDGVLAATTYMYATSGVTGWLTDMTIQAGSSTNGVILAKLNSLRHIDSNNDGKINSSDPQTGCSSSWPQGYSGFMLLDNISIYKGTAPKNLANGISVDFEDAAFATDKKAISAGQWSKGENALAGNTIQTAMYAPSLATYSNEIGGNWAVKFDMQGATAATTLTTPFLDGFNSRAYDLKVKSDGSWTPVASGKVTWDMIEGENAVLTKTGSLNGTNDKPIYYYWDGGDTVHVYNNNGTAVDSSTVGKLNYYKVTLVAEENYNALFRAMCGGQDANNDKNYYLTTPALTAAGTYVFSADYYIPANASGIAQGQMYTNWVDLYRFDLTNKKFCSANSSTAVGDLAVNAWNNVTMIVTIAEGQDVVFDIYLNGVFTHTITKKDYKTIPTNDWVLFKAQKPGSADLAKQYVGNVYVDNVSFNVVSYDAANVQTVDTTKAPIAQIGVDGNPYVDVKGTSVKIYTTTDYGFVTAAQAVADYADMINTELKASIRLSNPTGLRFATLIDTDLLEALKEEGFVASVEYGTLIAPMDDGYMGSAGKQLTLEDLVAGETVLKVVADDGQWFNIDEDDATTHYVGSIVNIHETNMARAFSGRGYVSVTLANGTVYNFYSETIMEISVAAQAQKTIDAGSYAEDSAEYGILAGFAAYLNK